MSGLPVVSGREVLHALGKVGYRLDREVATGITRQKVDKYMKSAIEFRLDGMRAEQKTFPAPHSYCLCGKVSA